MCDNPAAGTGKRKLRPLSFLPPPPLQPTSPPPKTRPDIAQNELRPLTRRSGIHQHWGASSPASMSEPATVLRPPVRDALTCNAAIAHWEPTAAMPTIVASFLQRLEGSISRICSGGLGFWYLVLKIYIPSSPRRVHPGTKMATSDAHHIAGIGHRSFRLVAWAGARLYRCIKAVSMHINFYHPTHIPHQCAVYARLATMPLNAVYITAATLTVGTLFYGIYSVLFFLSIYLFVHRYNAAHNAADSRKRNSIYKSLVFGSAIFLFVVVTTHWLIIVYRGFLAFGSLERLALGNRPLNEHTLAWETAQDSVLSVAILLGDSLISWTLLMLRKDTSPVGRLGPEQVDTCGSDVEHSCIELSLSTYTTVHNPDVFSNPWLRVNVSLTLITTVYCTVLISWRIWTVTRISILSEGSNLRRFLVIVVESAAFYALVIPFSDCSIELTPRHGTRCYERRIWTLFFAIAYAAKFSLQVFVITTGPAVVGIVNALIHTRVGLGWASESEQGPGGRPMPSSLRFAMPSSNSAHGENGTTEMASVRTDQQNSTGYKLFRRFCLCKVEFSKGWENSDPFTEIVSERPCPAAISESAHLGWRFRLTSESPPHIYVYSSFTPARQSLYLGQEASNPSRNTIESWYIDEAELAFLRAITLQYPFVGQDRQLRYAIVNKTPALCAWERSPL
ncbi:hypothetical protein GGX14DRAFT_401332 [Mycena pura]|uniref:Uncharacterized protein n=1 Tax=Mycena pura TaxID=153505 RepID=A0AAD6V004_9AGAR|nr:hypothetical protein GGX14DRAFT_401332 [Mycena pura]